MTTQSQKAKLIVYDWNGCLLDDFVVAHTAMNRILKNSGREEVDAETYRDKFDMPFTKLFDNFGFAEMPVGNVDIYNDTVREFAPHVRLREGVETILVTADENNVRNVIVSNARCAVIHDKLTENKLDVFFADVVGSDHPAYGTATKNKSDNLACYLDSHPADEIILIGDTFEEIDMAERFKGTSVSIAGGYISAARLSDRAPDYLINNMFQFGKVLEHVGFFQRKPVI